MLFLQKNDAAVDGCSWWFAADGCNWWLQLVVAVGSLGIQSQVYKYRRMLLLRVNEQHVGLGLVTNRGGLRNKYCSSFIQKGIIELGRGKNGEGRNLGTCCVGVTITCMVRGVGKGDTNLQKGTNCWNFEVLFDFYWHKAGRPGQLRNLGNNLLYSIHCKTLPMYFWRFKLFTKSAAISFRYKK
jgi:hypothetical protein